MLNVAEKIKGEIMGEFTSCGAHPPQVEILGWLNRVNGSDVLLKPKALFLKSSIQLEEFCSSWAWRCPSATAVARVGHESGRRKAALLSQSEGGANN